MTAVGVVVFNFIISIYRVFPRVILRVRAILDSIFLFLFGFHFVVHPRRRLGGTGGPVAPFTESRLDDDSDSRGFGRAVALPSYNVFYGDLWSIYSPLSKGGWGVPHSSLLAVTVRTDTKGVGRGSKGGCIAPIRCGICGLPLKACDCLPGFDY